VGAVSFSIDKPLVAHLKQLLPLPIFVETGTFEGDSLDQVLPLFEQLYSVELSPDYYQRALQRFQDHVAVQLYHDRSKDFLQQLQPMLQDRSVLYWLDAHWCVADETAGEESQCPLLEELAAIGSLNPESVILIDDARLFLCTPPAPHRVAQWASLDAILRRLFELSAAHEVMILNDVMIYYPAAIRSAMQDYAHAHSIDWLKVLEKLRHFEDLVPQIEEKEVVIQEKQQSIAELAIAAGDRLQIIHEQEQKIAQLEYAIEQLKQQQTQRIKDIRRSKRETVQKIVAAAKTQQDFIRDQTEQIKVLKRSLESTIDRRMRRRLSSLSRFFDQ
jgi:hypothetical protein